MTRGPRSAAGRRGTTIQRPLPDVCVVGPLASQSRAGDDLKISGRDRRGALFADQPHVQRAGALPVQGEPRRAGGVGEVPVTPVHQRDHRERQFTTPGGEPVLGPGRPLLVLHALQYARVDQALEPLAEDVSGQPQALPKVVEAGQAEKGIPDDEQGPSLTEDLQRASD